MVKEEGYGGLMKGFRPAMVRAFPANAACFTAMEISKSALSFLDSNNTPIIERILEGRIQVTPNVTTLSHGGSGGSN